MQINASFDVCFDVCRQDHVGADDVASESKMVRNICKRIGMLRMEYKAKVGNCMMIDNLDELYRKLFVL